MANPRELAEQAIALLQNALSESEARASDLDEQLKRKRSPKNRLEEQLDVLSHRLESVDAERQRWEQQAGHLEEIAEAERAKVAQLRKKLEIAESGPDKLTKKEINFWRQKAETIDAQIKEYQERLTAVRTELGERDALIETLRVSSGAVEPAPAVEQAEVDNELRRQLEQRDGWLAELRLELHELRAQPTAPLETQAEVETLRGQIAGLERALAEAHNIRAAVQADLMRMQQEIAGREQALNEAIASGENATRAAAAAAAEIERLTREAAAATEQAARETAAATERVTREAAAATERVTREAAEATERATREAADAAERATREAAAAAERVTREAAAATELATREAAAASERADREAAAAREAAADGERARATLGEREHRIVELSAEVEHLRNELRQTEEQQRTNAAHHDERVATLTRDADALRSRLEQDRHDTAAARAALELELHAREQELDRQRQSQTANERDVDELRQQLAQREQSTAEARRQLDEQQRELLERDRELADRQQQLRDLNDALAERDQRFTASSGELEHLRVTLSAQGHDIDSLRETLQNTHRELEQARTTLLANERELASLRETLAASSRELDELRSIKQRLEQALEQADARATTAEARATTAASDIEAAREQMAGLESELKEEREHAESLGELANERREHMTKLQEQVEEAEERFAEANWKLRKAMHFERIVKRRKGLIIKLLEALRGKMKSNVALKAGLDGLRTFKAQSEMNQHKLLQRIDSLKADLKEAEETVKRHQGGTAAKEELTNAISRATALEERLNTQAELIQSLEADLKTARLSHKAGDDKHQDSERLAKELETKNQIIAQLQADADEQQRKLSKLRGSEGETVRLKALTEKDRNEIDALQREVAQLRDALTRQGESATAQASGNNAELEAKLKEREHSVTRLMGTIKEHEASIKKLTESSDSWKRKYQFLASDQPDAYKNAAEK